MEGRSRHQLWYGRDQAPAERLLLHAGPVSCILDGADLRHVRVGDVELVQRVYVAVRDAPWNTIPAELADWRIEQRQDRFRVTFSARHRYGHIDYTWNGQIGGTPDGVIVYEMDGVCRGTFAYSKIGLNIHHALEGSVGHAFRAHTADGELRGVLPKDIEPQRIVGGTLTGMFAPYRELAIDVGSGVEARIGLEGDLLELQDHRNWTDANFKSYGTPLALGFPRTSTPGQRIRQVLTISHAGAPDLASQPGPAVVHVGRSSGRPLPAIGFGMASHSQPLSPRETALLRITRPDHIRVDLVLAKASYGAAFDAGVAAARALDADLELAIFTTEQAAIPLGDLAERIRGSAAPVARVLVYPAADGFSAFVTTTPASLVVLARERLEPVTGPVVFAGGTNQNFSDINRDRPTDSALTGVCFSVSPTVHAADDWSIVENLAGQSEVVEMARSLFGDRAIVVSPVTLATRFGPYPAGPARPGGLPPAVDVRQASLLGAAWTVGSIQRFAEGGAASVTYYETTGWRGVVETDGGPPISELFPSRAGQVFPVYHVFADVAEWKDGRVRTVELSDSLRAVGLAMDVEGTSHVLVGNVTPEPQEVRVSGLEGTTARVRILDEASAEAALLDPTSFRTGPAGELAVRHGQLSLELLPFAVARLDIAH